MRALQRFDWTPEREARLAVLWGEGASAAVIGQALGCGKNAAVGKAHRMGLPPRPAPIMRVADSGEPEAWVDPLVRARRAAGAEPLPAGHWIALAVLDKARRLVLAAGLLAVVAGAAGAAPPAGAGDPAAAEWFRGLLNAQGIGCCSEADCRRTAVRPDGRGGLEAWMGQEQFGDTAPDAWLPVPAQEVRSRGGRPPGVRGAIACWYQGRVFCADLEDGS